MAAGLRGSARTTPQAHKGLRRLYETGNAAGLPAAVVEKLRNILSFPSEMDGVEELQAVPSWKLAQLDRLLEDDAIFGRIKPT